MDLGLKTNLLVTLLMFVMVVFMPIIDWAVCRSLGISPDDHVSENPKADHYLHIRKIILYIIFGIYVFLLLYVAFFSRSAADDYLIHISLYEDLANAVKIDFGILGFIRDIFVNGFQSAMSHVKVEKIEDIVQVYLNVVLFVPMGYLLPYVFDFFRRHIRFRVILACFLISLAIENIQLITKLGFYDIDDLISNTIGGALGQRFYMWSGYVLAHPDFRKEWARQRRYRKRAKDRALYSFFSRVSLQRTTLYARDKKEVFDFYENKLGFRLKRAVASGEDMDYLFEFGKDQIEVRCRKDYKEELCQEVTIACNNSEYMKKKLERFDIHTSEYKADPYTDLRTFSFDAPGNTKITIIEE